MLMPQLRKGCLVAALADHSWRRSDFGPFCCRTSPKGGLATGRWTKKRILKTAMFLIGPLSTSDKITANTKSIYNALSGG
jgi:hypothetical protein